MPKNEIAVRIFELADKLFAEQRDFAVAIGVTPSIVSQWRNDNTTSFKSRLDIIAQVLGTTADYLLTGEKEKPATVSGSQPDFLIKFQSLTPEDQKEVMVLVEYKLGKKGS